LTHHDEYSYLINALMNKTWMCEVRMYIQACSGDWLHRCGEVHEEFMK